MTLCTLQRSPIHTKSRNDKMMQDGRREIHHMRRIREYMDTFGGYRMIFGDEAPRSLAD